MLAIPSHRRKGGGAQTDTASLQGLYGLSCHHFLAAAAVRGFVSPLSRQTLTLKGNRHFRELAESQTRPAGIPIGAFGLLALALALVKP